MTNTKVRERGKKLLRLCVLLGVVEFISILQHSSLSFLHHVPLDGTRSDGVDQVNHWQAGADQVVLQKTEKTVSNANAG